MKDIIIKRQSINIDTLNETLKQLSADTLIGISTRPGKVVVHLQDNCPATVLEQVRNAVVTHDATQESAAQQSARKRYNDLKQLRRKNRKKLRSDEFEAAPLQVKKLAQRVTWLEEEIRLLQNLDEDMDFLDETDEPDVTKEETRS